jgi:hypothetical protein
MPTLWFYCDESYDSKAPRRHVRPSAGKRSRSLAGGFLPGDSRGRREAQEARRAAQRGALHAGGARGAEGEHGRVRVELDLPANSTPEGGGMLKRWRWRYWQRPGQQLPLVPVINEERRGRRDRARGSARAFQPAHPELGLGVRGFRAQRFRGRP